MGLALDGVGAGTPQGTLEEAGPHAAVDVGGLWALRHERPERTRGSEDHGRVSVQVVEHGVEAERAHRGADTLEPVGELRPRAHPGGACELTAEVLARAAERILASVERHLVEQSRDERGQAAGRELERLGLGRGGVQLRRAPGAGTGSAGASCEARFEQTCVKEPFQSAARHAAVNSERGGSVPGGDGSTRAAHIEQGGAQIAGSDRIESVHDNGKSRPVDASCID